jgi:hypothetical protein
MPPGLFISELFDENRPLSDLAQGWRAYTMKKRLIVTALVGFTIAASLSTSASAFQCLAQSANGVSIWGYGVFFRNAAHYAVRHCRVAGGVGCHVVTCR